MDVKQQVREEIGNLLIGVADSIAAAGAASQALDLDPCTKKLFDDLQEDASVIGLLLLEKLPERIKNYVSCKVYGGSLDEVQSGIEAQSLENEILASFTKCLLPRLRDLLFGSDRMGVLYGVLKCVAGDLLGLGVNTGPTAPSSYVPSQKNRC